MKKRMSQESDSLLKEGGFINIEVIFWCKFLEDWTEADAFFFCSLWIHRACFTVQLMLLNAMLTLEPNKPSWWKGKLLIPYSKCLTKVTCFLNYERSCNNIPTCLSLCDPLHQCSFHSWESHCFLPMLVLHSSILIYFLQPLILCFNHWEMLACLIFIFHSSEKCSAASAESSHPAWLIFSITWSFWLMVNEALFPWPQLLNPCCLTCFWPAFGPDFFFSWPFFFFFLTDVAVGDMTIGEIFVALFVISQML